MTKKLISLALVLAMVLTLFAGLTITAHADSAVFNKVTSITSGKKYLIVYGTNAFDGSAPKDKNTSIAVTDSNGTITADSSYAVTITTSANAGYYNLCGSDGTYFGRDTNSNGMETGTSPIDVTITAGETFKITGKGSKCLGCNGGTWRFYASSNAYTNLSLYEMQEGVSGGHIHSYSWDGIVGTNGQHTEVCANTDGLCTETTRLVACTFGDWTVATAATTTSVGDKTRTCSVCGYVEHQEIPMIGEGYNLTAAANVVAGTYYLAIASGSLDGYKLATTMSNNSAGGDWNVGEEVIANSGVLATADVPNDATLLTFTGDNTNGFTIQNPDGDYLGFTSAANRKLAFSADYSTYKWTVIESSGKLALSYVGSNYTISNNSTNIRGYANTTVYNSLYLFQVSTGAASTHTHSYSWDGNVGSNGQHTEVCANTDGLCTETTRLVACTFGDWTVATAATTTSVGDKTRTCSVCGYVEHQEIPMVGEGYELTAAADVVAGTYYLAMASGNADGYKLATTINSSNDWDVSDEVTLNSGVLEAANIPATATLLTFTGDNSEGFTIQNPDGDYLGFTEAANRKLAFGAYSTTKWTVAESNGKTYLSCATGTYTISNNSTNIRGYASTTVYNSLYLFKVSEAQVVVPDVRTIYIRDENSSTKLYIHLWGGTGAATEWPGAEMTFEGLDYAGCGIYSYEVDTAAYVNFIINNKVQGEENRKQTGDLLVADYLTAEKVGYFWSQDTNLYLASEANAAPDNDFYLEADAVINPQPTCGTVGTKTYKGIIKSSHTYAVELAATGEHTYDWESNASGHWKQCTVCGAVKDPDEFAAHDTNGVDGACSVCGYKAPELAIPYGKYIMYWTNGTAKKEASSIEAKYIDSADYTGDLPVGLIVFEFVEGNANGTYAIKTPDGNYLEYHGSSNEVYTSATLSNQSSWEITAVKDDQTNEVTGYQIVNCANTDRYLQYNSASSGLRFACYKNTQNNPMLMPAPVSANYSLTTGAKIGINLYFENLPDGATVEVDGAAVALTNNAYTIDVAAKDYKTTYVITVNNGATKVNGEDSLTVSVAGYIAQEQTDTNTGAGGGTVADVVKAMSNFSAYSAAFFGNTVVNSTDLLAISDDLTAAIGTIDADTVVMDPNANAPRKFSIDRTNTDTAELNYYGTSLILESQTVIRHYFTSTATELTATVEGAAATVGKNGSFFYVDIPVAAADLNTVYTVVVSDGTHSVTVNDYSATSYIRVVLRRNDNEQLVEVVKALYVYYKAAAAYFG